jgi:hypothetical protein
MRPRRLGAPLDGHVLRNRFRTACRCLGAPRLADPTIYHARRIRGPLREPRHPPIVTKRTGDAESSAKYRPPLAVHPRAMTLHCRGRRDAGGECAVEDPGNVVAIAQRAAEPDPRNPAYQTLVGATQYRSGRIPEAIGSLEKSPPLHALAEFVAPKRLDPIRSSRPTGETILAVAYRDQGNSEASAKQVRLLRSLIDKMASTPPQYSEGTGR